MIAGIKQQFIITSSCGLLALVSFSAVAFSCSGESESAESSPASYDEYGELVENLSNYFQINRVRSRNYLAKCLAESEDSEVLLEANDILFENSEDEVAASDSTTLSTPLSPSDSPSQSPSPAAPSASPSAGSSARQSYVVKQGAAAMVLETLASCKDFRRIGIKDYEENFIYFENLNCVGIEIWQKIHVLILNGKQIISEEAEELGKEFVYCTEYLDQLKLALEAAYPWFQGDCIYNSSIFKELEKTQIRIFADYIFTSAERDDYEPTTKWELTDEETTDQLVRCIDYPQVRRALKADKNIEKSPDFEECVKMHSLEYTGDYDLDVPYGIFTNRLDQVTANIPLCVLSE